MLWDILEYEWIYIYIYTCIYIYIYIMYVHIYIYIYQDYSPSIVGIQLPHIGYDKLWGREASWDIWRFPKPMQLLVTISPINWYHWMTNRGTTNLFSTIHPTWAIPRQAKRNPFRENPMDITNRGDSGAPGPVRTCARQTWCIYTKLMAWKKGQMMISQRMYDLGIAYFWRKQRRGWWSI